MKKNNWEKLYSWLGFWTYTSYEKGKRYLIIYWCLFPFWFFKRIDLIRLEVK